MAPFVRWKYPLWCSQSGSRNCSVTSLSPLCDLTEVPFVTSQRPPWRPHRGLSCDLAEARLIKSEFTAQAVSVSRPSFGRSRGSVLFDPPGSTSSGILLIAAHPHGHSTGTPKVSKQFPWHCPGYTTIERLL